MVFKISLNVPADTQIATLNAYNVVRKVKGGQTIEDCVSCS